MTGESEMGFELLRRHVRTRGVQLGRAVKTADAWEPDVFYALRDRLSLDWHFRDRIEVRIFHHCLKPIIGVLLLKLSKGFVKPLWRRRL
jgi:hypothetical protein